MWVGVENNGRVWIVYYEKIMDMNSVIIWSFLVVAGLLSSLSLNGQTMNKALSPFERSIMIDKGTERPFSGALWDHFEAGSYHCRQCGARLFSSDAKFDAGCGWPSFDDAIAGAVATAPDADGRRTEILCARCGGHLGHLFTGEGFTPKNHRHCVNSASLEFVPLAPMVSASESQNKEANKKNEIEEAIFAGGCFWGVEHLMQKQKGVISVESGYSGGHTKNPTYAEVCTGTTGHLEVVKVRFNPAVVSYETVARLFFEIHDPTQTNGQGPDLGEQYLSAIFYKDENQKLSAGKLIGLLQAKGYKVATQLRPAAPFWPAETYHQDYYEKKGTQPYCHRYTPRF